MLGLAQVNVDRHSTAAMMLVMRAAHAHFSGFFSPSIALRRMWNVIVVLLAVSSLAAQSETSAAPRAKSRLATAIDRTLEHGHDAILPPHVSHLLGISPQEHEVPVKQFTEMEEPIRGFEVSTAEHNNVVVFVEKRVQKESTFYLTSQRGTLRKVLSVIEGVGYDRLPTKDDKEAFEKEKQHWVDLLAPKHL